MISTWSLLENSPLKYIILAFLALLIIPAICSAQKPHPVVCIDPGHPSEVNPGFQVQNGTTETHIDWVVAIKLQKLLKAKGFTVVMTKSKEKQMVRNKERALIANRAGAAMMVRLHCDSSTDTGYAIYYPNRTGTAQGVTGPSAEVREKSRAAAEAVESMMKHGLEGSLKSGGVRGDDKTFVGGKQGALTGSIFSKVPIITIEMVVLNNRHDADFIKKDAGQLKMAQAIAAGIEKFVGSPE